MLGGFSQGGATALAAGLSYHRRLAGLVCISGWCPDRTQPRAHAANAAVPVFFSYGTADPVVTFPLAHQSALALKVALPGGAVTVEKFDRGTHPPKRPELAMAADFIRRRLSSTEELGSAPAGTTAGAAVGVDTTADAAVASSVGEGGGSKGEGGGLALPPEDPGRPITLRPRAAQGVGQGAPGRPPPRLCVL